MNDNAQRIVKTDWLDETTIVARLQGAVATLSRHNDRQPVRCDFVAHAENVSGWITMTCGYSLVEQALKAVLWKRSCVQAEQRGRNGHNLAVLYDAIPKQDKLIVELEFSSARRRYGDMPWLQVADFLNRVQHDSVSWRYLLIEEPSEDLSLTHPEVFLSIAIGLVKCFVESGTGSSIERPRTSTQYDPLNMLSSAKAGESLQRTGASPKKWRSEKPLVHGLGMTQERLKMHLGSNYELANSINPDSRESASAWLVITCGFTLLEQALKALLYRRNDSSVERSGACGHQIDRLFSSLPDADRSYIDRGFATYISLFDEITDFDVEKLLRRIGSAYNSWRYVLIERPGKQNLQIHPGALLEISHLVIDILNNEVFTNHGMHDLGRRLDFLCLKGLNQVLFNTPDEQGLSSEIQIWLHKVPNLLTGFAAYLRGEVPDSKLVADVLIRMESQLTRSEESLNSMELRRYLLRGRQHARPLVWDSMKRLFI